LSLIDSKKLSTFVVVIIKIFFLVFG